MISIITYKDATKLSTGLFTFINISGELAPDTENQVPMTAVASLAPSVTLWNKFTDGDMKKKKFLEKYKDKLKKSDAAAFELFTIIRGFASMNKPLMLIVSKDEYKSGWPAILAKRIEKLSNVEVLDRAGEKIEKNIDKAVKELKKKDRKKPKKVMKIISEMLDEHIFLDEDAKKFIKDGEKKYDAVLKQTSLYRNGNLLVEKNGDTVVKHTDDVKTDKLERAVVRTMKDSDFFKTVEELLVEAGLIDADLKKSKAIEKAEKAIGKLKTKNLIGLVDSVSHRVLNVIYGDL